MPKPLAIAPRLLVHVGLGLGRLAPFAERMKVALAVGTAVDDGDDVIAGPQSSTGSQRRPPPRVTKAGD
jgi:hypothetical protein